MDFGKRLKEARIARKYTQEELAKRLGITKGAVSLYEKNLRSPKNEMIMQIMYVLGVSANYLFDSDIIVEFKEEDINKHAKYRTLTKEELYMIEELRKDKLIYETLFEDPKRGIEIIKNKIG